jgi:hypothetical protein
VSGRSSGRIECAAQPASSARTRVPRNRARSPGPAPSSSILGGFARCHDTDDTNHGSGDTHTILWSVKMTGRRNAKLAVFSVANENYGSCISSGNQRGPPGLGSPRPRSNPAHPTILLLRLHEAVAGT